MTFYMSNIYLFFSSLTTLNILKLTSYYELIYLHFPQKKKNTFTIFSFFVDKFHFFKRIINFT